VTLQEMIADLPGSDRYAHYRAALARLPPAERELIVQRCEQEASYEEIAARFGLASSREARTLVSAAMKRLASELARRPAPVADRRPRSVPRFLAILFHWPWRDSHPH
jgi:DNA-directed RNA polymerase specialized sigma24 family protein